MQFNLEERTYNFAREVRIYCKTLHLSTFNSSDIDQVLRSSGSIGANYIEANEALSKKDFAMRIKICRKEAKETIFWLKLLSGAQPDNQNLNLQDECVQLMKIFGAILEKTK